jgi:hypothetical protein
MHRTAVILATIVAFAWQPFAAMASTVLPGDRADVVHSVMHWQDIPHHHGHHHHDGEAAHDHAAPDNRGEAGAIHSHDDGTSLHVDDSEESLDHMAADHCCPPVLLPAILTPPFVPGGITPGLAPARPEPSPMPGGLFRPPRPRA